MRAALLVGLIACNRTSTIPPSPRPAVAAPCVPGRVGKVIVQGADPTEVAPLAVLEGTLDDPERADRIALAATDLLHARGYTWAKINVTRAQGCGVELHANVDRGPKFRIAAIDFKTDDDFPADQRLAAVEDALGSVNAIGGAYVEDRMQRALAALLKRYSDAGWIQASIEVPRAQFDAARGEVRIVVPIHAGHRFKIGNVLARGGKKSNRIAVLEALGFRGGEWYDGSALRAAIERARRQDHDLEMKIQVSYERDAIDVEAELAR